MKFFVEPWLEIVKLNLNEIVATSQGEDGAENPDLDE